MTKINPEDSARARFAYELQRHRVLARLTQGQLGRRIGFSGSLIGAVENLKRTPSDDFAKRCDHAFGLDGVLTALHVEGWPPPPPVPLHFRDWTAEERRATALQTWDPMLVPGMFQTEEYARRVFSKAPGITPEEIEERVIGRMQRKTLLTQEKPPTILSLLDEGILHRPIGGPEVMRRQLQYLIDIARHPLVTIQIVPLDAEAIHGLLAAFVIAEQRGTPYTVYVESLPDGRTLRDRSEIVALTARYDSLRAEAYPQSLSLKVIKEAVDRWT
ncbi:Scr1 family TA system antitoxin-like transcriptional regulator [Sphaerisporangium corydalis]|uniref:Scr1 family TA system antitoxin-like transcriptional regulator n=2 Tax=Sphaerisporangium corydalis TaxID=1441875 RepID=A0ABV9E6B9_9ACTN